MTKKFIEKNFEKMNSKVAASDVNISQNKEKTRQPNLVNSTWWSHNKKNNNKS